MKPIVEASFSKIKRQLLFIKTIIRERKSNCVGFEWWEIGKGYAKKNALTRCRTTFCNFVYCRTIECYRKETRPNLHNIKQSSWRDYDILFIWRKGEVKRIMFAVSPDSAIFFGLFVVPLMVSVDLANVCLDVLLHNASFIFKGILPQT